MKETLPNRPSHEFAQPQQRYPELDQASLDQFFKEVDNFLDTQPHSIPVEQPDGTTKEFQVYDAVNIHIDSKWSDEENDWVPRQTHEKGKMAILRAEDGAKLEMPIEEFAQRYFYPHEADQPQSQSESFETDTHMSELGNKLLEYEHAYGPKAKIEANGRSFGISAPVKSDHREMAVLWSEVNGSVVPRLLYKSNSAGDWRAAYRIEEDGRYAKEALREGDEFHYTQENKIHDDIAAALDELETHSTLDPEQRYVQYLEDTFKETNIEAAFVDTAEQEIIFDKNAKAQLAAFCEISAGQLSIDFADKILKDHGSISSYFKSLDKKFKKLAGFMPDFKQAPAYIKQLEHPVLGAYKVEAYQAVLDGKPITWTMGLDSEGRAWIDGIKFTEMTPSSYGTGDTIIDSGVLTSKPIDYKDQTTALSEDNERKEVKNHNGYMDISPALKNLLPVKNFLRAKKKNI